MQSLSTRRGWILGAAALLITAALSLLLWPDAVRGERQEMYRSTVAWLDDNALPDETLAMQDAAIFRKLTDRVLVEMPSSTDVASLLDTLMTSRPDYCLALHSVPWEGVQASLWFLAHYSQVFATTTAFDSVAPLTLYRYHPSPFDAGEDVTIGQPIADLEGGRLMLQTARLSSQRLTPGDALYVTLTLSGTVDEPLTSVLELREVSTGRVLVRESRSQPGGLPTDIWPTAKALAARYEFGVPASLPAGNYELTLSFQRPNLSPFGEPVSVGSLFRPPEIAKTPPNPDHSLNIGVGDAVRLVGYDGPGRVEPGDALSIALYWQALASPSENIKVFIHVVGPDGSLVAQSDAIPVNWSYPTTAWQRGDYVRDVHALSLDAALPRGDYHITAGMYNAETGDRAAVVDAQGTPLPDDLIPLYTLRLR